MNYTISTLATVLNLNGTNDLSEPSENLQRNLRALASSVETPRVKLNITEADAIPASNRVILSDFINEMRNSGIDLYLYTQPEIFKHP